MENKKTPGDEVVFKFSTFLPVVGSAFKGVLSFLPYTFKCLTPCSGEKKNSFRQATIV